MPKPKQNYPKCRVEWQKPYRTYTICNYVDEMTNECKQTDANRCPCGGIIRTPGFENKKSPPIIYTPDMVQNRINHVIKSLSEVVCYEIVYDDGDLYYKVDPYEFQNKIKTFERFLGE